MIRNATNDLTIKPKMSTSVLMGLIVGGLFVFFASLYMAYSQGVETGHEQFERDQGQLSTLRDRLSSVELDLDKAQEALIFAQRQKQIQEEAYKQLNLAYGNSEQKNAVLGARLDFYRSIISPEDGQSGPAIQSVTHSYESGQLGFDITLVQAISHKKQVRGNVKVSLYENDLVTERWPNSSSRSVSYQYFQQVSGVINKENLAENAKLKVELKLQGGETLEKWVNISSNAQNAG